MKITRYAQSCILIETKGLRILVDPGLYQYEESFLKYDWKDIDILLVTHKDLDHCHVPAIEKIISNEKTKFYTNSEVARLFKDFKVNIVKEGDKVNIKEINIKITKAIHGYIPFLKGKFARENLGFIVDDGDKKVYLCGDTLCFENSYECDILLVPVSNSGLVMGPYEASVFAKEINPQLVIPYHYESQHFPGDLNEVKIQFEKQDLNYKILEYKETIVV